MDTIAEIRRRHLVNQESISSIARDLKLSRQPYVNFWCWECCATLHCTSKIDSVSHAGFIFGV